GCRLGLVTGNTRGIAIAKLRQAGLDGMFVTGAFGDEAEDRQRLISTAMSRIAQLDGRAVHPRQVAVVGDTPLDIEAGRRVGVWTVGTATGPFGESDLRR